MIKLIVHPNKYRRSERGFYSMLKSCKPSDEKITLDALLKSAYAFKNQCDQDPPTEIAFVAFATRKQRDSLLKGVLRG